MKREAYVLDMLFRVLLKCHDIHSKKVNDSKEPPIEFGNFWLWGDPEGIQEAGILGLQFRDVQSKPLFPCLASISYGTKVRSFPCRLYHLFGPNIRSIQYS